METFYHTLQKYSWKDVTESIYRVTSSDVTKTLNKPKWSFDDFKILISPAAKPYLEQMALISGAITRRRFGKVVQLYIPLYLSNKCTNDCIYCGFNRNVLSKRITLTVGQAIEEAKAIRKMGFHHVLLVTGEYPDSGYDYLYEIISKIKPLFSLIAIEVPPMDIEQYFCLKEIGLNSVYIYQETYHEQAYPYYHPKGKKSNFRYRLETPDRIAKADMYRIGLGCLLGLEDWRVDSWFTALHIQYLSKKYWKSCYSISLPRIRKCAGGYNSQVNVSEKDLLQLICAYRMVFEDLEIALSTREDAKFRDLVLPYGITTLSAGSKTYPGAYAHEKFEVAQFEVGDLRPPSVVLKSIEQLGFKPVWKDWDKIL